MLDALARSFWKLLTAWVVAVGVVHAGEPPVPSELPTRWQSSPGDALEHMTAGFAKILCSALFITGRDLATASDEDGFFVSPRAERRAVTKTVVDSQARAVHLTLPSGVTRSAVVAGDQGCVTLPRGAKSVFFTPIKVRSVLPDPTTQPWPMGDQLPAAPLPPEVAAEKVADALRAAFDPPEALTAAFVVAYKGHIIAERYQSGLDHTTRLPGWSMGKSLTATLSGQLIHEGVYDLWAPAPVPAWRQPDDVRRTIRIADLLRMSSGLRFLAAQDPDYDPARGYPDHYYVYTGAIDAFEWAITRPPQWQPNTVGRYRNSDPLVLGYLIKQAALARKEEYLSLPQRRLFDKIGIRRMVLETDPYGTSCSRATNSAAPATGCAWDCSTCRMACGTASGCCRRGGWISCAPRRRPGRGRSMAGCSGSTARTTGPCPRMPTTWPVLAASIPSSSPPTTWWWYAWGTTRGRGTLGMRWLGHWNYWCRRCPRRARSGSPGRAGNDEPLGRPPQSSRLAYRTWKYGDRGRGRPLKPGAAPRALPSSPRMRKQCLHAVDTRDSAAAGSGVATVSSSLTGHGSPTHV